MKSLRLKSAALLFAGVLIVSGSLPGWISWREVRQHRLNQALVAAARHHQTQAVIQLLAQGADANARDMGANPVSVWRLILDRLRGVPPSDYFLGTFAD
jgi:hypothetical protein